MRRKPAVDPDPVRNRASRSHERIAAYGAGTARGLIAFTSQEDGTLDVRLFEHPPTVRIQVDGPALPLPGPDRSDGFQTAVPLDQLLRASLYASTVHQHLTDLATGHSDCPEHLRSSGTSTITFDPTRGAFLVTLTPPR